MLEVNELRKVYPTGDEALKGVSATIGGNEIVAMIGPSGAGKSTFIRCINRLTEPTDGAIRLDGTDLVSLTDTEMKATRRDIGMVFQEYNLVERLTVMENVLSGRLGYVSNWAALRRKFPQRDIERAYDVLETVGLAGMEDKRADVLSGGQRQRVGIARAVVQEPTILLADEPTSSLDPESSHAVMDLLTEIAERREIPVIINIHEVPLAIEYSDRILGLHDGELVYDGPAADLDDAAKDVVYRGQEAASEFASVLIEESEPATDDDHRSERSAITGD
jgi:phosphonate transport system ATP-binding protein